MDIFHIKLSILDFLYLVEAMLSEAIRSNVTSAYQTENLKVLNWIPHLSLSIPAFNSVLFVNYLKVI